MEAVVPWCRVASRHTIAAPQNRQRPVPVPVISPLKTGQLATSASLPGSGYRPAYMVRAPEKHDGETLLPCGAAGLRHASTRASNGMRPEQKSAAPPLLSRPTACVTPGRHEARARHEAFDGWRGLTPAMASET